MSVSSQGLPPPLPPPPVPVGNPGPSAPIVPQAVGNNPGVPYVSPFASNIVNTGVVQPWWSAPPPTPQTPEQDLNKVRAAAARISAGQAYMPDPSDQLNQQRSNERVGPFPLMDVADKIGKAYEGFVGNAMGPGYLALDQQLRSANLMALHQVATGAVPSYEYSIQRMGLDPALVQAYAAIPEGNWAEEREFVSKELEKPQYSEGGLLSQKGVFDTLNSPLSYVGLGNEGVFAQAGLGLEERAAAFGAPWLAKAGQALALMDTGPDKLLGFGFRKLAVPAMTIARKVPAFDMSANQVERLSNWLFSNEVHINPMDTAHPDFNPAKAPGEMYGGSFRAKLNKVQELASTVVQHLDNNGINANKYAALVKGIQTRIQYPGSTELMNKIWADRLDGLEARLRDPQNPNYVQHPLAKVWGLQSLQLLRNVKDEMAQRVAGIEDAISNKDVDALKQHFGTAYDADILNNPKESIRDQYRVLHQRFMGLTDVADKMMDTTHYTTPFDSATEDVLNKAQAQHYNNNDLLIKQAAKQIATTNELKDYVDEARNFLNSNRAAGSPQTAAYAQDFINRNAQYVSDEAIRQMRQSVYAARNDAMANNWKYMMGHVIDSVTGGPEPGITAEEKLVHLMGGSQFVKDFMMFHHSLHAQSLGQELMGSVLPPQVADYYHMHWAEDMPKVVDMVQRDKNKLADLFVGPRDEAGHYPRMESWASAIGHNALSMHNLLQANPDIGLDDLLRSANAYNPVTKQWESSPIKSLADLLRRTRTSFGPNDLTRNELLELSNRYDVSGDLLFDDVLKLVPHILGYNFIEAHGPTTAEKVLFNWSQMLGKFAAPAQLFKEWSLVSPKYHSLVSAQALYNNFLHGISPLESTSALLQANHVMVKEMARNLRETGSIGAVDPHLLLGRQVREFTHATGQDVDPSILAGGLSSALKMSGAEREGGAVTAPSMTERLGWAGRAALFGIPTGIGVGMSSGNPLEGLYAGLGAGMLGAKFAHHLVNANTVLAKGADVSFRSLPWLMQAAQHVKDVAPEFLDRFGEELTHQSPVTPGVGQQIPGFTNLQQVNVPSEITSYINALRARNGQFSQDSLRQAILKFNIDPSILNTYVNEWGGHLYDANVRGVKAANHTHFDFASPSNLEEMTRFISPFYIWMYRLVPFMLQHLLEHPVMLGALIEEENRLRQENEQANRLSPKYTQFGILPQGAGLASFLTGINGSQMMGEPMSMLFPGTGLFKPGSVNASPSNQVLGAMEGLGLGTYPWDTSMVNAAAAAGHNAFPAIPSMSNQPYPGVFRLTPLMEEAIRGVGPDQGWQVPGVGQVGPFGIAPLTNATQQWPMFNQSSLVSPTSPWRNASADPEGLFRAAFNAPEIAMNQVPEDFNDIETKRRLAQMAVDAGQPNSPRYVMAMQNPLDPLYLQARDMVSRQSALTGSTTSFMLPFRTMEVNPTELEIERQRSEAAKQYGPQTEQILSRYLPSVYPDYAAYGQANRGPGSTGVQTAPDVRTLHTPIGDMPQIPQNPMIYQTPDQLVADYLTWAHMYIPPDQWFTPQTLQRYMLMGAHQ